MRFSRIDSSNLQVILFKCEIASEFVQNNILIATKNTKKLTVWLVGIILVGNLIRIRQTTGTAVDFDGGMIVDIFIPTPKKQ